MQASPRFMKIMGFVIPFSIFLGLGYVAVVYSSFYAFLGMVVALLIQSYRWLMQIPPIRRFLGLRILKVSDTVLYSEKTWHFFSGLTIFYFILISPFAAIVLYSVWALYLSKFF